LNDRERVKRLRIKKAKREKDRYGEKQGQVLIADCEISKCSTVGIYS